MRRKIAGLLCPVKPMKRTLPSLFRLQHRLRGAAGGEDAIRVVGPGHLVDLPEIEVVGLQPAQALLQLDHRVRRRAVVGAVLGHQEDLVAVAILRQRHAHAPLRLVVVVLPGVVHEGDAVVDGGVDEADGLRLPAARRCGSRPDRASETSTPVLPRGRRGMPSFVARDHCSPCSFVSPAGDEARFLADAPRVR